jgi:hypothetical protein
MGENLFYLVDAGFNNLARPILYGAYHPMSIAPADGDTRREELDVVVGGPLCESGDIFTQEEGGFVCRRLLPAAVRRRLSGDGSGRRLRFCHGLELQFEAPGRRGAGARRSSPLVRSRQTFEDLIRGERIPARIVWHNGPRDEAGPAGADWTAHHGDHSLRFRYPAGEAWSEQRFDLGRAYPEIWIRYWLRVPRNFQHGAGNPSNHKFFALWMDGYSQHGKGPTIVWNFWRQADGNSRFSFSHSRDPVGAGHHGLAPDFLVSPRDRGRWMQIVLHAKMSSAPAKNDGEARIWRRWQDEKDLALISETVGRGFHAPEDGPQGWSAGYLLGWANAAYAEDTEWLLDSFTVSDKSLLD